MSNIPAEFSITTGIPLLPSSGPAAWLLQEGPANICCTDTPSPANLKTEHPSVADVWSGEQLKEILTTLCIPSGFVVDCELPNNCEILVKVPAVSELPASVYVLVCSPAMCVFSPYILKYSLDPPSLTLGNHFLANPPAVAKTIADDRAFLPLSEVAKLIEFLASILNELLNLPPSADLITSVVDVTFGPPVLR